MIKSLVIKRFISCVFIGVSMAASVKAFSQDDSGSVKKPLLASVYSPKEDLYVIKAANVIFPEILQGNEEQASEYVASFCTKKRDYLMKMYDKGELGFAQGYRYSKKRKPSAGVGDADDIGICF